MQTAPADVRPAPKPLFVEHVIAALFQREA
jgi:hypothetical protein